MDADTALEFVQRPWFHAAIATFVIMVFGIFAALVGTALVLGQTAMLTSTVLYALACPTIFLGWLAWVAVARVRLGSVAIIRLGPDGFWDRFGTAPQVLPWAEVRDIRLGGGKGGGLFLSVTDATLRRIVPSAFRRGLRRINWMTRHPTIVGYVGGLDARPRRILELTKLYAAAHGGPRID